MVLHCLWKMSATPGACIKPVLVRRPLCLKVNLPSCVARRPLCDKVNLPSCVARQPLCHKVNLPRCEARRRHLIMTFDIFSTGQTNTLTLCYLLGKTYKPAHSSAILESLKSTRSTKDWKSFWREPHTHFIKGFDRVSAKFEVFKTVNSM